MSHHTDGSDSAEPEASVASEALVATDRGARYGKQLASHLGRRAVTEWDETGRRGTVLFSAGRGSAELVAEDSGLRMRISPGPEAGPDTVAELEDVLGRHLVRFGARDELVVSWTRVDGTAGSEQRLEADPA